MSSLRFGHRVLYPVESIAKRRKTLEVYARLSETFHNGEGLP